jgi:DNA-binding NarL/FixJ family response regulator
MSRPVIAIVRDLFFRSKIDAVASVVRANVEYASDLTSAVARIRHLRPLLIVVDLSDPSIIPDRVVASAREASPDAAIIGFASHVDVKTLDAARRAGFTAAYSKSEFTARLAELLGATAAS